MAAWCSPGLFQRGALELKGAHAVAARTACCNIESNTFMGDEWTDLGGAADDESDDRTVFAQYDVVVDAELLDLIHEPATGITVADNVTLTVPHNPEDDKESANDTDRLFRARFGATMLLANNVDRSYQCVPDSLAPGNRCNPVTPSTTNVEPSNEPLNRCEVTEIPPGCSSRDQMAKLPSNPGLPETWLATLYGANIDPDVCKARAEAIWDHCAEELGTGAFTIRTVARVDGYLDPDTAVIYPR